jgi:prepilin-type N-terminal cleavage/methylation domain-containing protein
MSLCRSDSSGYSAIELLIVLALAGTLAAMTLPMSMAMVQSYRISGDAHNLSNSAAVAKMAAAAQFTRARLRVDLTAGTYQVERWQKTGAVGWVAEGGLRLLATGDSFGAGGVTTPPPNTQVAVAQAPLCRNDAGATIANTACVIFNSRGVSVDESGAPTAVRLFYVSGPTAVFSVVVSGTSQQQLWRNSPGGGTWQQQ